MPYFESHDGTSIFYRDRGKGTPLVFLPSWAVSGAMWQYQMLDAVDGGHRAVCHDRRGHGRSDDPGSGYEFDSLADDLAALLDKLDLTGVTLVGHSMAAGEIVRYLTRHSSGRISRIAFVGGTVPYLGKTDDNPDGSTADQVAEVVRTFGTDFAAWIEEIAPPFFGDGLPGCAVSNATKEWTIRDALQVSLAAAIECFRANATTDFRPELAKIDVPTLIVNGDHDASASVDTCARRTAELVSGSELKIYPYAPHAIYLTHRAQLSADLLAFAG